jgi:hypothetical protein
MLYAEKRKKLVNSEHYKTCTGKIFKKINMIIFVTFKFENETQKWNFILRV